MLFLHFPFCFPASKLGHTDTRPTSGHAPPRIEDRTLRGRLEWVASGRNEDILCSIVARAEEAWKTILRWIAACLRRRRRPLHQSTTTATSRRPPRPPHSGRPPRRRRPAHHENHRVTHHVGDGRGLSSNLEEVFSRSGRRRMRRSEIRVDSAVPCTMNCEKQSCRHAKSFPHHPPKAIIPLPPPKKCFRSCPRPSSHKGGEPSS